MGYQRLIVQEKGIPDALIFRSFIYCLGFRCLIFQDDVIHLRQPCPGDFHGYFPIAFHFAYFAMGLHFYCAIA